MTAGQTRERGGVPVSIERAPLIRCHHVDYSATDQHPFAVSNYYYNKILAILDIVVDYDEALRGRFYRLQLDDIHLDQVRMMKSRMVPSEIRSARALDMITFRSRR